MACDFIPYYVKSAILTWFPTGASYTTSVVIFLSASDLNATVSEVWHGTRYVEKQSISTHFPKFLNLN